MRRYLCFVVVSSFRHIRRCITLLQIINIYYYNNVYMRYVRIYAVKLLNSSIKLYQDFLKLNLINTQCYTR